MKYIIKDVVFSGGVVAYTLVNPDGEHKRTSESVLELKETLEHFASSRKWHLQIDDVQVAELMVLVEEQIRREDKVRKYIHELCLINTRGDKDVR